VCQAPAERALPLGGLEGWEVTRGAARGVPVEHEPWPLTQAELTGWRSEGFIGASGSPNPTVRGEVLFSRGVDVRLGFPQQ
jgi:uncharacterized protein YqjF (DUF2071 family)